MKMKQFLIREKHVGVGKVIFLRINKDLKFPILSREMKS